jgi:hypothetical protein
MLVRFNHVASFVDLRSPQNSNENKMSEGGRGRASLGVFVWKSSHRWSAQRSAVRSIAWLGAGWLVSNRGVSFLLQKPFVNIGLVIDIQNKMIPSLQNVETRVSAGRLDRLN